MNASIRSTMRATVVTLAIGVLAGVSPIHGQAPSPVEPLIASEKVSKLDALFLALRKAQSEAEAAEFVAEIWRQWLVSGKADIDALMQQAIGGMQSRNFGLASLLLDEVVDTAPEFAEGWNRRATLRYMMGDHKGSLADIEETLKREPRHFGALAGRGLIHIAAEEWQAAREAYRAALAVNPYLPERTRVMPELEKRLRENKL